jgi:hypothetical protein
MYLAAALFHAMVRRDGVFQTMDWHIGRAAGLEFLPGASTKTG